MEVFGLFLFLSMVLYLIDKNHAWGKFWKGCKALAIVALIAALFVGGYSYWSDRRAAARRVTLDMSTAQPIDYDALAKKNGGTAVTITPDVLPADFDGWDKVALKPWEEYCIKQIRAKYPGAYDDLSDIELLKHIRKKYPEKCPIK